MDTDEPQWMSVMLSEGWRLLVPGLRSSTNIKEKTVNEPAGSAVSEGFIKPSACYLGTEERLDHSKATEHRNSKLLALGLPVEFLHFHLASEILGAGYAFIPAPGQGERLQLLVEVGQVPFFVHVFSPYLYKREIRSCQLLAPLQCLVICPAP